MKYLIEAVIKPTFVEQEKTIPITIEAETVEQAREKILALDYVKQLANDSYRIINS